MTPQDRDDDALRSALRELRAADERVAPPLGAVLGRPRVRRVAWPVGKLALAAAFVLVVGSIAYRATRPEPLAVPREVIALSSWRPMTDVLLDTPNSGLLKGMPRLGASVITPSFNGENR